MSKRLEQGFSMVEIVIVVVILGILASVAIPKLNAPTEVVRSSEGQQILLVLLGAQKRYQLETGGYASALASLDVDNLSTPKNFAAPTVGTSTLSLASIQRSGSSYTLTIDQNGIITCSNSSAPTCAQAKCTKGGASNQCNR